MAATGLVSLSLLTAACSNAPRCDEPAFYESATGGKRLAVPDDLDELDGVKEFVIPEASPQPPRDQTGACLEMPPTLKIE